MEIEILILQSDNLNELHELITVFETVFEMENFKRPGQAHLQNLLNREHFFPLLQRMGIKSLAV